MVLETERLALRPIGPADFDEFVDLHAHPDVSSMVGRYAGADAEERLRAAEEQWRERGYGMFALTERDTGRFVGRAGLNYWQQFDEAEIGWTLRRDAWGNGYATEAATACLDWGFEHTGWDYFTAMIVPHNERSLAVARRLGMSKLRDDALLGDPVIVHAMTREEWSKRGR